VERNRFEETVRHFGVGASRRQLLGGLIGSTAAALAGVVVGGDAADAAKKGGKSKKTKTSNGKQKGVGKGKGIGQGNGGGHAGGNGNGNGPTKPKTRGFNAEALGSVDQPAQEGCQLGGTCTTTFAGAGTADHLGEMTFESSLTADWSNPSGDTETGFCALVAGTATFTATSNSKNGKGTINLTIKGTVCESVPMTGYPLVLDGTYDIVGGTGRFLTAKGAGDVSGSVEGAGVDAAASFTATGNISY
jgi:hypothetical protein